MGSGKGSAPKPPDPYKVADAQTGQSVGSAIANQLLGNRNQVTPYGNLTHQQTGTTKWTDPTSGRTYDIPQYTSTTTLSPDQQKLHSTQTQAETNLAGLARDQSAKLGSILGRPVDMGKAPTVTAPQLKGAQGQFGSAGPIELNPNYQSQFGSAGDITRTYGTDFSKDRQRVEDALMQRMQPQLDSDRGRMEANLAARGIKLGSTAYDRAQDIQSRSINDARLGAILGAGDEQSRMVGMEADRAAFENSAQGQRYNQLLGRAQFANQARGAEDQMALAAQQQRYSQLADRAGFANQARAQDNAAAQQMFQNQQGMRGNYLQEQYAARNQPINEIAAILGTGQVQNPMFANVQSPQMPTTDMAGLINQNYDQRLDAWRAQQANNPWNGIMGGLFGLGRAAIMG